MHKYTNPSGSDDYYYIKAIRTIQTEINQPTFPPTVNAAHCDSESEVYLLHVNTMYRYLLGSSPSDLTYTYVSHFDITQNGPPNPFSAGISSTLPSAPSGISALHATSNMDQMLAFVGIRLYYFDKSTQKWSDEGDVMTPCSDILPTEAAVSTTEPTTTATPPPTTTVR